MMTLHLLAPPPLALTAANSMSALSGLALRFGPMMRKLGYRVIVYDAGVSEAEDHVSLLSADEVLQTGREFLFISRAIQELAGLRRGASAKKEVPPAVPGRAAPGDVVLHTTSDTQTLIKALPECVHVEPFVGYDLKPIGAHRVYPSQAWRHIMAAKYSTDAGSMIPHFFDVEAWPFTAVSEDYLLFAGRMVDDKYGPLPRFAAARPDLRFVLAGDGSPMAFAGLPNVTYVGVVAGAARAALYGGARALLCPTAYPEPFGCSAIEANLCGTPVVAPDFGAFTETVMTGVNGARYMPDPSGDTLSRAIDVAVACDRAKVRAWAESRYSLEAVGPAYGALFGGQP